MVDRLCVSCIYFYDGNKYGVQPDMWADGALLAKAELARRDNVRMVGSRSQPKMVYHSSQVQRKRAKNSKNNS